MSRIGKAPIAIPKGVKISRDGAVITIEGPKGKLSQEIPPPMEVDYNDKEIVVKRPSDSKYYMARHGLYRALLANMVTGVTSGFSRSLEIIGVGYRAEKVGKALTFYLGYSHPISMILPEGISAQVEGGNKIIISGIDKQVVGQVAAEIRGLRPPEPYKGKGVRYAEEKIRKKAGKTAGA